MKKNMYTTLVLLLFFSCSTLVLSNKPDLSVLNTKPSPPRIKEKMNSFEIIKELGNYAMKLNSHVKALHEYLIFLSKDEK